jgi:hypothetical protein
VADERALQRHYRAAAAQGLGHLRMYPHVRTLVVLGRQVGDSRLIGGSPPSAVCLRRLL